MKYSRKTEYVDAFQYNGEGMIFGVPSWLSEAQRKGNVYFVDGKADQCYVVTNDGPVHSPIGNYIVKFSDGSLESYSPFVFEETFVSEEPAHGMENPDAERVHIGAIDEFKSTDQLKTCLKWWQHKLYLDSWAIRANVTDNIVSEENDDSIEGYNTLVFESEMSNIQIISKESHDKLGMMDHYCAEKILVHELLHCKYAFMENNDTYEGVYVGLNEHRLLEQMAKTLIMAKYGLDYDYFVGKEE